MTRTIPGIHHVTAIASDPQANIDFYAGILGLRMVKLTVNYDDPTTYHLYYGDKTGSPGTVLTFFPWPGAPKGRVGTGQLTLTSFSIPSDSLGYWTRRLKQSNVPFERPVDHFDESIIFFSDPDGLKLQLVANQKDERTGWAEGPVPSEPAIRGFYGVTLSEEGYEQTANILTKTLGFRRTASQDNNLFRFEAGEGGPGSIVDVHCQPDIQPGIVSSGTVHHVAWRTPSDEQQRQWRNEIVRAGLNVTPVIDRRYFHSIYFREPGGVLFEIATEPPGFTVDEDQKTLGSRLMLPPWLEQYRNQIQQRLPRIRPPKTVTT